MSEQTFKSPNFYEREIDLSAPAPTGPTGVPALIIGTANKGPAFVPVTVSNFNEFIETFGNLDPDKFGPYAANEFDRVAEEVMWKASKGRLQQPAQYQDRGVPALAGS